MKSPLSPPCVPRPAILALILVTGSSVRADLNAVRQQVLHGLHRSGRRLGPRGGAADDANGRGVSLPHGRVFGRDHHQVSILSVRFCRRLLRRGRTGQHVGRLYHRRQRRPADGRRGEAPRRPDLAFGPARGISPVRPRGDRRTVADVAGRRAGRVFRRKHLYRRRVRDRRRPAMAAGAPSSARSATGL